MTREQAKALTISVGAGAVLFLILVVADWPETSQSIEYESRQQHNYQFGKLDIYEWRDMWGRVCTFTKLHGGREQALDCDWPNTVQVE